MPFLSPNQQRQSTEGKLSLLHWTRKGTSSEKNYYCLVDCKMGFVFCLQRYTGGERGTQTAGEDGLEGR